MKSVPDSTRSHIALRIVLLSASVVLPILFMTGKSLTGDEAAHLPAGYSYLKTRTIILNPEHPPLIKEVCALPLLFLDAAMPADRDAIEHAANDRLYEWRFGRKFFSGPDRDRLLFWGRVPAVILSFALAALTLRWASELWGAFAGSLALFLYAFDPTITAHAQLVTTDVGFALFTTSFVYFLRQYLGKPSWLRLSAAGVTLGLSLGAKFSGLMLIPLAALLLAAAVWLGNVRLAHACGIMIALLVVAAGVLWAVYLGPSDPLFYIEGLRQVQSDTALDYPSLLMGSVRPGGFPEYFLVAWLVKTPIPSLLILGAALVMFFRGRRLGALDELFVAVPPLVLFLGYSMRSGQIGVRYLIPCLPFLFIFMARVASTSSRALAVAVAALLAWYLVEYVAIAPDHLSYFNEIAGGSRSGTYWLDDSNVDWGQGFIQLSEYLRAHPVDRYFLCSFPPNLDPVSYGLNGTPIWIDRLFSPPNGTLILSGHCVARARALLSQQQDLSPSGNWLASSIPSAIIGHAFYVYEVGARP